MASFLDVMCSTLAYFRLMSQKLPLGSGSESFSQIKSHFGPIRQQAIRTSLE